MPSPLKKPESMYDIIFKAVTKEGEDVQKTATQCKRLFKQKDSLADSEVLTQLEKTLRERQDKQAIKKRLESSEQGTSPEALAELEKSVQKNRKRYDNYTQRFLPALLEKITQSKKLEKEKAKEIGRIISEIISKSSDKYSKIEEQPINSIKEEIPVSSTGMTENNVKSLMTQDQTQQELESLTKEEVCASESDSGIGSPRTSEENLELPVSSRRSSVSSILSSAGENNDPQKGDTGLLESNLESPKENESQAQPEQAATEEPQVSSQCVTLGSREKESMDPNSQTTQMTGSQAKDSMQPEEKRDRKNAITIVQKLPVNEKKDEDIPLKQPNNRNLHVALVAGCALSTIGCIVAGAMTSGLIGAGLLAMAAVFAIAAVAELHSNFLSSKLTSINVEPHVNDKELTACSRL